MFYTVFRLKNWLDQEKQKLLQNNFGNCSEASQSKQLISKTVGLE